MTPFTLQQLVAAARAGLDEAEQRGVPSGLCLVDDGGHVLVQLRHPDAPVGAGDSALTKARTAAWLGFDTGALPPTSPVVPAMTSGVPWSVAVFPGGLVLRQHGRIVGAVGVGGSTDPSDDVAAARAAAALLTAAATPAATQ
ncbi:heme-binding protein [Terrabacter lapilli]|uniref:Heme-binding protein n=1 Tax=Terrabacter lapilli TaxID=436231 RepID=A0ABN2S368_9MICO